MRAGLAITTIGSEIFGKMEGISASDSRKSGGEMDRCERTGLRCGDSTDDEDNDDDEEGWFLASLAMLGTGLLAAVLISDSAFFAPLREEEDEADEFSEDAAFCALALCLLDVDECCCCCCCSSLAWCLACLFWLEEEVCE